MKKKILFVGRSIYHFSYYCSILDELAENSNICLTIMFSKKWSKDCPADAFNKFKARNPHVKIEWIPEVKNIKLNNFVLGFREIKTYLSYCTRTGQSLFYRKRWNGYIPRKVRVIINLPIVLSCLKLLYSGGVFNFFEKLIPPESNSLKCLKRIKPDLIYASPVNLRFSDLTEVLKSARHLSIPLVYSVLSWDNLTTKGLFHVKPEKLLVWNQEHYNEAITIHGFDRKKLVVTGSPFFDKWFDLKTPKTTTYDFTRPYILYLGSSGNIAKDESWVVESISKFIKEKYKHSAKNVKILVKPHPANTMPFERLKNIENIMLWPASSNLPETDKSQLDFYAAVSNAEFCVGINTSAMIDVAIMQHPCFALMLDEYKSTQEGTMHFQHLLRSNAIIPAHTISELFGNFLDGKNNLFEENAKSHSQFVEKFIRPRGRSEKAGKIACSVILSMLK